MTKSTQRREIRLAACCSIRLRWPLRGSGNRRAVRWQARSVPGTRTVSRRSWAPNGVSHLRRRPLRTVSTPTGVNGTIRTTRRTFTRARSSFRRCSRHSRRPALQGTPLAVESFWPRRLQPSMLLAGLASSSSPTPTVAGCRRGRAVPSVRRPARRDVGAGWARRSIGDGHRGGRIGPVTPGAR